MVILNIIAFIFAIGIIIIVHEAGHFYTAKKAGILCYEFSIGMGPAIKKWQKGETIIAIRMIPIGGYVAMANGDIADILIEENDTIALRLEDGCASEIITDESIDDYDVKGIVKRSELKGEHGEALEIELDVDGETKLYPVLKDAFFVTSPTDRIQITPYDRTMDSKPLWQRFVVLFAGAFMNFLTALVICLICAFVSGTPNHTSNKVGEMTTTGRAYEAGIRSNDQILKVNGVDVNTWDEFTKQMIKPELVNDTITITYKRDNETTKEVSITPDIYIYNVGITNVGVIKKDTDPQGVKVGKVAINYDNDYNEQKLLDGDTITAVKVNKWNGSQYVESNEFKEVSSWKELISELSCDSFQVYFKFIHDGKEYTQTNLKITAYSDEVLKAQQVSKVRYILGVSPTNQRNFGDCINLAFTNWTSYFTLVGRTLKVLIAPSNGARTIGLKSLTGVVGIFGMVSSYLKAGFVSFMLLIAMLSVNVGIVNLLPIPTLDGGRIVFLAYEGITKRKINKKFENALTLIMYVLLIALFIYITYNDILRLIRK